MTDCEHVVFITYEKKYLNNILILIICILVPVSSFAEEGAKVKNGKVEVSDGKNKFQVPIFKEKENITVKAQEEAISVFYTTGPDTRDSEKLRKMIIDLKKFYTGKKIFGIKSPAFKNIETGEHRQDLWVAKKCGKDGKGLYIEIDGNFQNESSGYLHCK